MNGEVCCILGVCCDPLSQKQFDAFATELQHDGIVSDRDEALKVAAWVLTHFDLAPARSLTALKGTIAKMARATRGKQV